MKPSISVTNERLLRLWGKPGNEPGRFHPVLFHMIDVGNVARALLGPCASIRWRRVLAQAFKTDEELVGAWVPWLVALHDLGKISEAFQGQLLEQRDRLNAEGINCVSWILSRPLHHTLIGAATLDEVWQQTGLSLGSELKKISSGSLGGHHGYFCPLEKIKSAHKDLQACEASFWADFRAAAADELQKRLLMLQPKDLPQSPHMSASIMVLTGFMILCDWLGSDQEYFPPTPDCSIEEYVLESSRRAGRILEKTGFCQPSASDAPRIFSDLFQQTIPQPRPLQTCIDDIPEDLLAGPVLAIIEAPTGEGKTEAALALAHRLADASGTDAFYYALPTTATSNQMFGRLQRYLTDQLGLPTPVKLIHGQAFLVEDDLRISPSVEDATERQAALEWFGPKKRAILAPFGVGTVDQAELAALNVKHVALRLLGLAGKVVVFDEVHSYDTYMTAIVERLLQWLNALGASVIILSATLPKAKRQLFLKAYCPGTAAAAFPAKDTYPSVWVVGRAGRYHSAPQAYQPDRHIRLNYLNFQDDKAEAKAAWLLSQVREGGCAVWITNTVRRAQDMWDKLNQRAGPNVLRQLIHAQFPLEDRQRLEREIAACYGPDKSKRPERGIVIGTSVLEQSLDLDFDVMVSDLAPVDLLLQRAGRLHRHPDSVRSDAHREPCLYVNAPRDDHEELSLAADKYIYAEYVLRQTWATLRPRSALCLPADYRPLVEAVYGAAEPPADSPLRSSWKELQKIQACAKDEAAQRLVPEPDSTKQPSYSLASRFQFKEDEDGAAWIVARTRLGEESVTTIPLERRGDWAYLPTGEAISVNEPASRDLALRLLRRSLRINQPGAVKALQDTKSSLPPLFKKSPYLKGYFPLWLTDGRASLPAQRSVINFVLHPHLGLRIAKK